MTKQTSTIERPLQKLPLAGLFALVVVLLVSNILGNNPSFSLFSNYERMEGWFGLLHVLGFLFLTMVTFTSREMYHKAFWATLIGSIGVLYAGGVDYLHRIERAILAETLQPGVAFDMRVQSTLGNAAYAGIYAVFGIVFSALLLTSSKPSRYAKWTLWALIAGHAALLYTTITRSSWLGLLAGIAVFASVVLFKKIYPKTSLFSKKFALSLIGAAVLTASVLLAIFFLTKDIPAVKEHPVLGRFAAISTSETTSRSRIMVWDMSLKGFMDKPILGYGQEGFGYVFANHYNPKLYDQEQWFDRAHNVLFDWLIAGGVLGFIAYITMFASSVYLVLRLDTLTPRTQGVLLGALAAYLVHILFVFDTLTSYISICLIFAYVVYETYREKLFVMRHESVDALRMKFIVGLSIVSFAVLFLTTAYQPSQKNFSIVALSVYMARAPEELLLEKFDVAFRPALFGNEEALEFMYEHTPKMFVREDVSEETKNYVVRLMLNQAEQVLAKDPYNPRHPYMLGMFLERIGMHSAAIQMLEAAVELSPNKQSFITGLADAYRSSGDIHTARTLYERAYKLDERNKIVEQVLGFTLYEELAGYQAAKNKQAEKELFEYIRANYAEVR
jgi:O-antigen ligase